jgi:hypothetical protein
MLAECADCGTHAVPHVHINDNAETICSSCAENYATCYHYDTVHKKEDMTLINDEWYSEDAIEQEFVYDITGELICRDDAHEYYNPVTRETEWYHEDDFHNHFVTCEQTHEAILKEDAIEWGGTYFTKRGYGQYRDVVNSYHSADHDYLEFRKLAHENTVFMGIELELEAINTAENPKLYAAAELYDALNMDGDLFYMEEDGSLSNGFEVISHPVTYQYLRKNVNLREIFSKIQNLDLDSRDSNGHAVAGLHIHLNRDAADTLTWNKVGLFTQVCQKQLIKFARREKSRVDRWAQFDRPIDSKYRALGLGKALKNTNYDNATPNHRHGSRYKSMNTSTRDGKTYEFRFFSSTVDYKEFVATLQYVNAVIQFCQLRGAAYFITHPSSKLWKDFIEYCSKSEYVFLANYLTTNKVY